MSDCPVCDSSRTKAMVPINSISPEGKPMVIHMSADAYAKLLAKVLELPPLSRWSRFKRAVAAVFKRIASIFTGFCR